MEAEDAYRLVLHQVVRWLDANMDPKKSRVFFVTASPTHTNSQLWGEEMEGGNCYGQKAPITDASYRGSTSSAMLRVASEVLGAASARVPVGVVNVTQMSEYRRDAHTQVYRELWAPPTPEQLADPRSYADCTHWCLPGVPDAWNELLYWEWLVVPASGRARLEEAGKHAVMARTGLPARDLRVLDPLLSYPSTILGRERAIVVNLERVKAVITAAEVLLPNSKDPDFAQFVRDLQARVLISSGQAAEFTDIEGESSAIASPFPAPSSSKGQELEMAKRTPNAVGGMTHSSSMPTLAGVKDGSTKVLPFEFRALEVCLESACRSLEEETGTLEKEAYPALDELTSKISTLNLERVRQIKSRLVAISGRVQKVRDELEHLLDDEMDMAEMYLTEKLAQQDISETSSRVEVDDHDPSQLEEDRDEDYRSEPYGTNVSFAGYKPNIEELEMLLEAYFVQIDGTLNNLSHLREYVDDTEDYINIMLDDKQNQLLQMGVMLSTATVVVTAGVAVVGLFGMNIGISLYNPDTPEATRAAHVKFWETTFGTIAGCTILYIVAMGWGKRSGLLQ